MDKNKTKALLLDELQELRRRNTELEKFQTQHHLEKKKLQESENIYKSIFESFYDVYYRTDKDSLITLISPSIQTQAGYDPKELIGLPVTDFYHNPLDREVFIEKLKENGFINDYESQLLAKDGRLIDVSISSRILVGKDGTAQGIEGILRNITERKKREEDQFLINELNNALKEGKSLKDIIQLTSVMTKKMFSGLGAAVYLIDNSNKYLELQNPGITSTFVKKIEKLINIKIPAVKIPLDSNHIYMDLLQKKEIRLSNTPDLVQQVVADFARTMEFGGKVLSKITKKMMSQVYKTLNFKSIYTVPLVSEDEVIGLLDISSQSRFSELDLERIKLIAGQLTSIIKRKQTEKALKESEEKLRSISDSAKDAIIMADNLGDITHWNPAAEHLFGYSEEEATRYNLADIIHSGSRPKQLSKRLQNFGKTGKDSIMGKTAELEVTRKDGKTIPVELSLSAIKIKDKWHSVGILRDITERKQTETALQESEARFRTLSNSAFECIVITDRGRMLDTNEQFNKIFGYKRSELIGLPVIDLVAPESRELVKKNILSGYEKTYEHQALHKDGTIFTVEVTGKSIPYDGRQVRVTAIRDITERKQAEEELRNSEERLKILFESAPDAYYLTDLKGKFIDGNRATEKVTGYKKSELVGKSFLEIKLLPKKQILKAGRLLAKNARGQATGPDEFILHQKDGTHIIAEIRTFPVKIKGKTLVLGIARDITDRKNAEKAIRESENRLKLAMEAARDGLFDWNMETGDMYFSPRYYTMLGFEPYEMPASYETWISLLHPGDRDYAVSIIQEYVDKKRKSHKIEIRLKTKSGGWRWILSRGKLIEKNEKGATKRMVGTHSDITERKQAEKKMINSNFWLEESQRVSKIGSYNFDILKNKWTSSKTLNDIFGISETDNKDFAMWVNIVHPEQKEEMLSYFQNEVLEKHVPFNKEYRIVRISDGEERWVHGLGELSFDENNNPVKMLGTIQDITERKLAEEERLLLSTAVEQSTEIIFITGKDSTIQYINPSFNKITGYSQDEVIGKSAGIFFKNGDRSLFDTIQEALKQGNSWSGHFNSRKKDGSLYEVESTISPIRDRSQKIINHVYVLRDVTHEMTIERQLQQAQKMEALGTLSGGIAHDFNNILTCIIGYTELALSDMPSGTLLERNLKQVHSAGKRGEDLVKQILAFSRQSEIVKKPVQVNLIIQEALKLLRSSAPASIQINQNIQSDSTVLADPTQIHQVFMNLFTNSLDAVRKKGGTVDVDLEDVWLDEDFKKKHPNIHPGQHIKLSVKDTGHGIEKSIVKQIFDPFFTTKELGKGTGLGLSVAHGIVKNHGGAISLVSMPNEGTTFFVFLPIDKNLVLEKEQVSTSIQGGQERILLVDDEPQVVNLEKQILERLGYTVETRENPLEALKDFRAQPGSYDLVVTDMTMPKMTGGELALQLMQIKPDIPIILCTGYSETMTEEKAKSLGIKEFIMKPIEKKNFANSIRNVLDRNVKRG